LWTDGRTNGLLTDISDQRVDLKIKLNSM